MKKFLLIAFSLLILPIGVLATSLVDRVTGYILLQVEERGEAWYVYPVNQERYYLGRPDDAFNIMRELGLGISNNDLESLFGSLPDINAEDSFRSYNKAMADRLSGQILLQVEGKGEAYYIYPVDKKGYYLGRPDDAFSIMRELGLGITNSDLEQIPTSSDSGDPQDTTSDDPNTTSNDASSEEKISLFGTLLGFNPNEGFEGNIEESLEDGWLEFASDESAFADYLSALEDRFEYKMVFAEDSEFALDREIPGAFTWNVIQPEEGGAYQWDLSDAVVRNAGDAGMRISALIHPFAAWDQDEIPDNCAAVDFAYYDYLAGTPTDWDAYETFVRAVVERYDGDGEDDMSGLTQPINEWEIGNEYDGTCGGDLNEAENLFELTKRSYEAIKEIDPDAVVLNAGALELNSTVRDIEGFWEAFFELGGGDYIDIFNLHYNLEKHGIEDSSDFYVESLEFFEGLIETYTDGRPMWITEFGTFSGTATINAQGGTTTRTQTEQEQAAWYFRYSILAFAHSVKTIFIDMQGMDNSSIGGSALYNQNGEERAFTQTLQAIGHALDGFSDVEELEEGQFLFEVDGVSLYALWDGNLPTEITGTVTVIDVLGSEQSMSAEEIEFDEESPVLVILK